MKYISLELRGFKRLALNEIARFVITPTEPIQLILGTNGSGKSSLMQELTPLPALSNDFSSEGMKIIKIEKDSTLYELRSAFSPTQKHNFIKEGLEMNPGGTLSVQRELVKHEFGITNEIHGLITSQVGLSSMSPSDRRYWFTKLSDTNYDYAISLYNRLREKSRDITGALKLAKNRLVTETAKIMSVDERQTIQEQVNELHDLLQHLQEYRKPVEKTLSEIEQTAGEIEYRIFTLLSSLMKKKQAHDNKNLTVDEAIIELSLLESRCTVEKILTGKYYEEHAKLQESVDALKATGGQGSVEINKKISDLHKVIEKKSRLIKLKLDVYDPINTLSAFETVYDTLTTVFATLPENSSRRFSKSKLTDATTFKLSLKDQSTRLLSDLNKLTVSKTNQEHQKDHTAVECPKCEYKWSKGFDEAYYQNILTSIETTQEAIDEVTIKLQESEILESEIIGYSDIYRQFTSCSNNWPILKMLWDYLLSSNLISDQPRMVLSVLESFKNDLKINCELSVINNEITRFKELLILSEKVGEADLVKLVNKSDEIEESIFKSNQELKTLNTQIKDLILYKKDMEDITELLAQIDILGQSFSLNYTEHKETFRRAALIDAIRGVQSVLAKKEQTLSEINTQSSIIADIQNQINLQEIDDASYKALVKELSPTDGLIAQGLIGFIAGFTRQMNAFIKKIWMYPLEVVPCGFDSEGQLDLDYKFPLKIKGESRNVPDVSKGSSAMKEVIDLAFKITAMKYLGLHDTPMFTDEFGQSFDAAHRIAAVETVKSLMDQHSFTQLFMISHYENSYSSLTNAQVCVLCSNNIVIPKDSIINQHVIIE